jgi:hypothetical protein
MIVSNHSHRLDCFQSKFQRRYRSRRMQSRQAGTLLSAFADCSGKLATAQSVSLANQIHDCAAVLNLHFARVSDCRLSSATTQDVTTTEIVFTCRRTLRRYVSTSSTADRCLRLSPPACQSAKVAFATLFASWTSQKALTL